MGDAWRRLCLAPLLVFASAAWAEGEAESDPDGPPEATVELPDMEVLGEKQELALRFIKAGLEAERSERYEDRNKPYCWFDTRTGSHQKYLYCGLNRSLNAESRYWQNLFQGIPGSAGIRDRRQIYRSNMPVNRAEIERMMGLLGPSDLNDEIVSQAMRGASLPDDLPDDDELASFAAALSSVRQIRAALPKDLAGLNGEEREAAVARADARMAAAIRDAGLTVERYNELSDLTERFESLRDRVRNQLARSGNGSVD